LVALGVAAAIAVSDQLILLLFDARYHLAAFMLPLLLVGVWFRVLGSFADAMLMGCGRAGPGAFANSAKFAVLLVGLPLAVGHASLFAALLVLILAEAARWAVLAPVLQGERLATVADDLGLTALLAVAAVGLKLAVGALGLAPTISEWWALGAALHG
jgi:O-antigen/teichoic acid export membrane protein